MRELPSPAGPEQLGGTVSGRQADGPHGRGLRAARKMPHKGPKRAFRFKGTRIGSLLFCGKRPFCEL